MAIEIFYVCFVRWWLDFYVQNNSVTSLPSPPSSSPHSMLLKIILWRWYWVTNVILIMLGLSVQREGDRWECLTVCDMISRHMYVYHSSPVDQRHCQGEYIIYSPAVGNSPVYRPGLGIQGNSLQRLLKVSHNHRGLTCTFPGKKRKYACESTLSECFLVRCVLARSYWLL